MPFWQQKSGKKGSERCLMFGPNNVLIALKWDDGGSSGHENVCQWFLNRYKTKKSCVSLKMFEMKFKFFKIGQNHCV